MLEANVSALSRRTVFVSHHLSRPFVFVSHHYVVLYRHSLSLSGCSFVTTTAATRRVA
jgi:hypothetical protein